MGLLTFIERMPFWQHRAMEYSGNDYTFRMLAAKHHMPSMLHPSKIAPKVITITAQIRIVGEHLTAHLQNIDVSYGLFFTPRSPGVGADLQ